jgi:hypothetical protein
MNGVKRGHTSEQLRIAIDSGLADDKVRYPDPAAAPLGTDSEAAGTPPTAEQVNSAYRHEVRRAEPRGPLFSGATFYVAVIMGIGAILTIALIFTG